MNDRKLDDLLELHEEENIGKNITISINKKIYKKVISIILITLIVITGGYYGVNYFMKTVQYDPFRETIEEPFSLYSYVYDDLEGSSYGCFQKFLLQTYVYTFYPGYYYDGSNEIIDLGFGRYELSGTLQRIFEGVEIGNKQNPYLLSNSKNELFSRFKYISFTNMEDNITSYENNKAAIIDEILLLPDTSIFEIYVLYKEPIPLNEWQAKDDTIYALSYFDEHVAAGFSLVTSSFDEHLNEFYPSYLIADYSSDELYTHYETYLNILLNHEDFLKTVSEENVIDLLESEKKKVEDENIEIQGYVAFASKAEIMGIMEDDNTLYVNIHDVKYSSFEK